MYAVLVYDICMDNGGSKVLGKVFKICKKYMVHVQKSTFEGDLTEAQLINLKYELEKQIRKELDSVIIFKARNEKWLEKEFLGIQNKSPTNFL